MPDSYITLDMKKMLFLLVMGLGLGLPGLEAQVLPPGQQLKSPGAYLGYVLGSRFSTYEQVSGYFHYVAALEQQAKLISYGRTNEGRELFVTVVSAKGNMERLEEIRKYNLELSQAKKPAVRRQPVILWLSYNIHGNEASSSETAMRMLYALTGGRTPEVEKWLENTVVVIDPCLNPDGRERYVQYFNSVSDQVPNADPMAREHFEPWPGGRTNHYYFDLNRDWAWQTQLETRQRLKLYRDWMPEVHVDFHEQNYNEPYYFAPAAEPIHVDITAWQREFQAIAGRNNAKYFDQQGWAYFTKERFDLLYPSYGDTYPLYNGAIGMTYEQGGIGAGLAVVMLNGDTLKLKDRIEHHFTTGMATLESVSAHAQRLVDEFRLYFERSAASPPGVYRTYVVKNTDREKLERLTELLDRNGIIYAYGGARNLRGFSYESKRMESLTLERNDLVVSLHQPAAVLANVLFEPQTMVSDPNTYDITAWSLPYAFGLKAYAIKESLKGSFSGPEVLPAADLSADKPYAWVIGWNGLKAARALLALHAADIRVRTSGEAFTAGGRSFSPGTLLVYRAENERVKGLAEKVRGIAGASGADCMTLSGGAVEKGKDLGSSAYTLTRPVRIGVVSGPGVSAQAAGAVWHFFEQELGQQVSMLNLRELDGLDNHKANVLVVPDGDYADDLPARLESWVNRGGKLILLENAVAAFSEKKPYGIRIKDMPKPGPVLPASLKYGVPGGEDLANAIPGAIFRINLDKGHPLSSGLGDYYYALKTDDKIYDPLPKEGNVGLLSKDSYVAGIAGKAVVARLNNGMLLGEQRIGRGSVVYLGTDVLFRAFWENGKRLFLNAVFLR